MDNDTLKALGVMLGLYLFGRWMVSDKPGKWVPRIIKGGKRDSFRGTGSDGAGADGVVPRGRGW